MKDKTRMYFDILVVIGIAAAIYYIKVQSTGMSFNPFDGAMAMLGFD
jgi:hypothetical protein